MIQYYFIFINFNQHQMNVTLNYQTVLNLPIINPTILLHIFPSFNHKAISILHITIPFSSQLILDPKILLKPI